ncbi:hypothetical protein KB1_07060 [Cutibacterium modestum]|uniref:Uncharacterized protein n=2 Tax=Cutibacterium modestum TaxID=2559073 RepID=A0AAD1KPC7_9ACTN|nr:hypothetical protein KB1_07060 [Cutibacterium modestum]
MTAGEVRPSHSRGYTEEVTASGMSTLQIDTPILTRGRKVKSERKKTKQEKMGTIEDTPTNMSNACNGEQCQVVVGITAR